MRYLVGLRENIENIFTKVKQKDSTLRNVMKSKFFSHSSSKGRNYKY